MAPSLLTLEVEIKVLRMETYKVAEFNIPNHITLDKGNNLVFMDVDPSSNTAHPNKHD